MHSSEIRKKFLEFFKTKGHSIIPSASLVPVETDPTVLFTTAGMHPLVPYLLGEQHSGGKRVANFQRCVRTGDIGEVGDGKHLTFFEMLGNWSFGDPQTADGVGAGYFKKEAVEWSWEFLTDKKWLGLDKKMLAVSVFAGDSDAPFDEKAFELWKNLGVPEYRIAKLPKKNNWWGPAGSTGPCGPDTEMFYWTGGADKIPEKFNDDNDLWIEIWNDVFMQYNKGEDGVYYPLKQKNVDTGMGLERVAMVMQGKGNVYETDLFELIIKKIRKLTKNSDVKSERIIADHIKASVFIIADGVKPSNTGRGYVLRRLIRRARYYFDSIGGQDKALGLFVEPVISIYKDIYKELVGKENYIDNIINDEEDVFRTHLMFGKKFLDKIIAEKKHVSGDDAFLLYSTYGFPFELILDMAKDNNVEVDIDDFNKKKIAHQKLSRAASVGMFKGGLADAGEMTIKYHTATHLLLAALREILGSDIVQKGSNITAQRLRFDFNYPQKMTKEQIEKTEEIVNEKIKEKLSVETLETPKEEALKTVKISFEPSKYGNIVKIYKIGDFSVELCGGPHVKNTGELGHFKIVKEEAVSAGVRRIKAVLE